MSALREALTEYVAIRRALGARFREAGLLGHEVFYRPSHGMATGNLGACRGRWSFLLARHAQDGAVLVLAVGGDAIGDGGAAGAPGWGWCGLGSGLGDFSGLSRCDQRG